MGCLYSKSRKEALRNNLNITVQSKQKYLSPQTNDVTDDENRKKPDRPEFTDHQKELVLESWRLIKEDMARVGVEMFMKLFENHPDVQNVFRPFKGLSQEDLTQSNQLRSHALRVMGAVNKSLECIDDETKLEKLLHDLGTRHVTYSAKVDYFDLIGPQFICAIEPVLADKWTHEMAQAWSDLFKLIAHIMKTAMLF